MAASSVLFLLMAASVAASASAATFTVINNCGFTMWPAATPVGGGRQLNQGETWTFDVPAGTSSGRVWGRTGCSFDSNGSGSCQTGDCAGALSCTLSGQPPMTLAEFTIGGAMDSYDISVIDSFNVGMAFSCSTSTDVAQLVCRDAGCPDAYHQPNDKKTHTCSANSNYQVTFCP